MRRRIGSFLRIPILAMAMATPPLCASRAEPLEPAAPAVADVLGYDFAADDPAAVPNFDLRLDVTLSDGWGSLRNSVAAHGNADETSAVRLDSALTRELRDEPLSMTFGDAVLEGGDWSTPLRFGGITIEPKSVAVAEVVEPVSPAANLESFMAPSSGAGDYLEAILPVASAIDREASAFAPEGFAVGSGEMNFAVSDAPGTDQLAALPAAAGLHSLEAGEIHSRLELGLLRDRYGIGSFDYGDPIGAATLRYGISGDLTGEAHAASTPDIQAAGLGLAWAVSGEDRITISGAGSRADEGAGMLGRVSLSHAGAGWDASLGYQMATEGFAQPGWDEPADRIARQAQAASAIALGDYGDLTVGYSLLERGDDSRDEIASFVLDMPLLEDAHLVAVGAMSRTDGSASIGFSLTIPLGGP